MARTGPRLRLCLVHRRGSPAPLAFLSALLFLANTSHFRAVYWISAVSQLREYGEAAAVLEELLRRYPGYGPAGMLQSRVRRMQRRERGEGPLFGG